MDIVAHFRDYKVDGLEAELEHFHLTEARIDPDFSSTRQTWWDDSVGGSFGTNGRTDGPRIFRYT